MSHTPVGKLTLETFSPWLKTRFKVQAFPVQAVELELTAATELPPPGLAGSLVHEAFSLLFAGPETQWLPQGTYAFEHDRIGKFSLFIVPVGKQAGLIQYQAIFNNLSRSA